MLMNNYEMQRFFDWMNKNSIISALVILGVVALIIILIYRSQWKKRRGGSVRYSRNDKHDSFVSGEKK